MRARAALLLCLMAVACAPAIKRPVVPPAAAPQDFPTEAYAQAAARGEPVFRIEPERSVVVMRVYRGGALARLGHDHVIASRDVRGYVKLGAEPRADLYAPLALLTVDEPALRAEAGFGTQPSQQDIEGTRRNMLDKVLEAERYPFAVVHLESTESNAASRNITAAVTLHGETRMIPVAIELDTPSADALYARGRFPLNQSDFGVTPFSVLGGALRVQDRVDVEFSLYGTRVPAVELSTRQ